MALCFSWPGIGLLNFGPAKQKDGAQGKSMEEKKNVPKRGLEREIASLRSQCQGEHRPCNSPAINHLAS